MRKPIIALLLAPLVCCAGCAAPSGMDDRVQIAALEHHLIDSFKARDLDGIMGCYIPGQSLFVFDVVPPRQYVGAAAYRKDWADLLAGFPGPVAAETEDLYVEVEGRMAYGHMAVRYVLTTKDGQKIDLTARLTDVYRKINGSWLIVHEHVSMPVELPSGKADVHSAL